MSEMKLIMENWRQYGDMSENKNTTLILREVKNHLKTHGQIQEGFFDSLATKIPGGKRVLSATLAAMIAANALAPSVASAAETYVGDENPIEQSAEVSNEADDANAVLGYLVKYEQKKGAENRSKIGGRDAVTANEKLSEIISPLQKYFQQLRDGRTPSSADLDQDMLKFLTDKVDNMQTTDAELYQTFVKAGQNFNMS